MNCPRFSDTAVCLPRIALTKVMVAATDGFTNKAAPEQFHRRSIRLKSYDYSQCGVYFLTLCTHKRTCLFGGIDEGEMANNQFGDIVQTFWQELTVRFPQAEQDSFVVMPNHVHAIINIGTGAIRELPLQLARRRRMLVPQIVGWFKMNTAKQINQYRGTPGLAVWQRNYWEHVVRNEYSLSRIREYVANNPLHWYLDVENPDRTGEDEFYRWLGVYSQAVRAQS